VNTEYCNTCIAESCGGWDECMCECHNHPLVIGGPLLSAPLDVLKPMNPGPERGGITEVPLCGNPQHPQGPWHPSAPLPFYGPWWNRKARRVRQRYEKNWARWGCGCDAKETV
jgi:hypothetical protein